MNKLTKSLVMLLAAVALLAGCTKKSSEKQILSFSFHSPEVEASIMESAKTIVAVVPGGTDVTALEPIITVSEKATVNPASGLPQDFTHPVTYTVTAEDGSQASYTVTVIVEDGSGEDTECTIILIPDPKTGGTVSGEGTYPKGENCTIKATPAAGYAFEKWERVVLTAGHVGVEQVSTEAIYTFTVTSSGIYYARFVEVGSSGSSGLFSVSETKKVYFALGNLQATTTDLGSTWKWAFAQNQWDYVGDAPANNDIFGNGTVHTNGSVDLFGWSTSKTYFGICSYGDSQYGYGGHFVDWGTNIITNGGGYTWFTLSGDEWEYLFNNHTYGWTTVNGVDGYVVRPDGVTTAIASSYTAAEWGTEEAAGALFLPAAGDRYVADVSVGKFNYWSSTPHANYSNFAYSLGRNSHGYYVEREHRCDGYSVRLARQAE